MPALRSAPVVCSAPGKVLLAGGYLILDRDHSGTVLALDARFHSSIEIVSFHDEAMRPATGLMIEVHSPQFRDVRRYMYATGEESGDGTDNASLLLLRPDGSAAKASNKYVEVPLLYGLTLLREMHAARGNGTDSRGLQFWHAAVARAKTTDGSALPAHGRDSDGVVLGLRITLAADNGFYSQAPELRARGWPLSAESLQKLPPMLPPRTDEGGDLAKTGLGSSATLVTSLLGALLHMFGAIELPSRVRDVGMNAEDPSTKRGDDALRLLHSLAQLCHCVAQGKVGSGFDVCSATYGSHQYTRFSPSLIAPLLELQPGVAPSASMLSRCMDVGVGMNTGWDHLVSPFALPPGVEVLMADVSCGANTPSMVKKVLAWRKASGAASAIWARYAASSAALQVALQGLCALHTRLVRDRIGREATNASWLAMIAECGNTDPETWPNLGTGDLAALGKALADVRASCYAMRSIVREVSAAADTPIEPPEQTHLLDATMKVRGVLMAVVPGAGGNDAVIALILPSHDNGRVDTRNTRKRVADMWRKWPKIAPAPAPSVVCELPVVESREAAQGHNGVLLEGPKAAEALCTARGDPNGIGSSPHERYRLLRILTQSELQNREGHPSGTMPLAIAFGVSMLAIAYMVSRARQA